MTSDAHNGKMFAAVRRLELKPGMLEEYTRRVTSGAVPIMRTMEGFRAFYVVASSETTITSLSLFANPAMAQSSTEALLPWIRENLGPLIAALPEAIDGELIISEVQ